MVTVCEALEAELAAMPASVGDSTLAASAFALARILDQDGKAFTARTMAAKELRETLCVLRAMAEPAAEDKMTEFERRRDKRERVRKTA